MQASISAQQRALFAIVGAAVLWSLGGVLVKSVAWNPVAIAGARSAIAALVLWGLYYRDLSFRLDRYLLGGAVSYAVMVLLFVVATKLTTAANAIFLQYTAPVYVALLAPWFLGEAVTRRDIVIIAVTLAGMALFFLDRLTFYGVWGNIAAIVSGMAYAWTCLFVRKQGHAGAAPLLLGNILAAAVATPFMMIGPGPDWLGWLWLLTLGVFQLGLSYALFAYAMKRLSALEVTLISSIEPVLNPIWVMLFLGEKPGVWALVGGVIVFACVTVKGVLSVWEARRN